MSNKGEFSRETKTMVRDSQMNRCDHCSMDVSLEFHHKIPNTQTNRKVYPHFLSSIFNCVGLCQTCHHRWKNRYDIPLNLAMAYDQWLATYKGK